MPVLYGFCILYITILSRSPSLNQTAKEVPLWSYYQWIKGNWSSGRSLLLNIVLFLPLGYLLARCNKKNALSIVVCLSISIAIETIQYFTYRGYFDVDDIISNLIGGICGIQCYRLFCDKAEKLPVSLLALAAGIIGCFIVSGHTQIYETQFDFQMDRVNWEDGQICLSGDCSIYNRSNLPFTLQLKGDTGTYRAKTEITEEKFIARIEAPLIDTYEIDIIFKGYQPIPTRVWLNCGDIGYVNPRTPVPDIEGTDLGFVTEQGTLKSYNADYEVFVYQLENTLYWLVGEEFDSSLIYQLLTDEPDNLPEIRRQYGFDNRGFRPGSEKEITGELSCGKYRVFSDIVPTEYHITAVMVGMNKGMQVLWRDYFRVR